jgi:hypothetical protein
MGDGDRARELIAVMSRGEVAPLAQRRLGGTR